MFAVGLVDSKCFPPWRQQIRSDLPDRSWCIQVGFGSFKFREFAISASISFIYRSGYFLLVMIISVNE